MPEMPQATIGLLPGDQGVQVPSAYACVAHALCLIWVAVSSDRICTVLLGHDEAALTHSAAARWQGAPLRPGCPRAERVGDLIAAHIGGACPPLGLPLQLVGTPFQRAVWLHLMATPPGQTPTYAQVAQALGRPRAPRAVGAACAKNTLALVVPCHRVVHGSGGAMGYRWGRTIKQQLLALESRA